MTREQVDRALERLGSEHDAIEHALLALQDHQGRRLLEGAPLTGGTRQRWSSAEQGIALLWSMFQTYQEALRAARTVRQRSGRRPNAAALGEISRILGGEGISVPGARVSAVAPTLTGGPARLSERVTLAQLVDRMNEWYAEIIEVVAAADAVWSELPSRIDLLIAEAGRVRSQAASVGLAPGRHPVADAVQQLCEDLAGLRAEVHGDPLSFFSGGPGTAAPRSSPAGPAAGSRLPAPASGRVRTERFDRAARELEEARREVEELLRLRDEAEGRMEGVEEVLRRADGELAQARQVRTEVLAKIAASEVPVVPGPATALYDRLGAADRYRGAGQWHELATLLDGLEAEAESELRRARKVLTDVRAPLALRDELRGRLDAYRAKVGSMGRIEDPELAHSYAAARRLLWNAPCDLAAAGDSVRRYQRVISEVLGWGGGRGAGPSDRPPAGGGYR